MQSEQDHMIEIVFICLSVVTLVHRAKQTIVKKEKELFNLEVKTSSNKTNTINNNLENITNINDTIDHNDTIWMSVISTSELLLRKLKSIKITKKQNPKWCNPPVALIAFYDTTATARHRPRLHAIQDACPHVAIGSLIQGDNCIYDTKIVDLEDIADIPVVACPVHSFTFDLNTGHCITDKRKNTPPALIYNTRYWYDAVLKQEMVQICMRPKPEVINSVSLAIGNVSWNCCFFPACTRRLETDIYLFMFRFSLFCFDLYRKLN